MALTVVLVLALAMLLLAARLFARETSGATRVVAAGSGVAGFLLAFAIAKGVAGKATDVSLAVGLFAGAVMALALLGQMRMVRSMTTYRRR